MDAHGNDSPVATLSPSETLDAPGAGAVSEVALAPVSPNPIVGEAMLGFALPREGRVRAAGGGANRRRVRGGPARTVLASTRCRAAAVGGRRVSFLAELRRLRADPANDRHALTGAPPEFFFITLRRDVRAVPHTGALQLHREPGTASSSADRTPYSTVQGTAAAPRTTCGCTLALIAGPQWTCPSQSRLRPPTLDCDGVSGRRAPSGLPCRRTHTDTRGPRQ